MYAECTFNRENNSIQNICVVRQNKNSFYKLFFAKKKKTTINKLQHILRCHSSKSSFLRPSLTLLFTLLCRCGCYGNLSCCYWVAAVQITMVTTCCFLGMRGGSSGEIPLLHMSLLCYGYGCHGYHSLVEAPPGGCRTRDEGRLTFSPAPCKNLQKGSRWNLITSCLELDGSPFRWFSLGFVVSLSFL